MNIKAQISREVSAAIQDKVFPGCVIGVVHANGERWVLPFGQFTYHASSPGVEEDTIYDLASITKSIPTGCLALQLIDEGRLRVTNQLIQYLPEFRNADRERVLIKHLLTYTIDGYGLASLKERSAKTLFEILMTRDFERRPGSVFKYTNIPAVLLGLVIEKITGETIDQLADECFFKPLEMYRTSFFPEQFNKDEIVPTEIDNWRGLVSGVVHDESAYICKQEGKIVGHAGLFSTVPDLLNFLEMLLNKGTCKNKKYFSEKIIEQMGTNQISELNEFMGLGWELNQPRYMSNFCSPHTFGKTGFTGTLCVVDVAKGIAYVILSNRIYPKRPPDSTAIITFRKKIAEILLSNNEK